MKALLTTLVLVLSPTIVAAACGHQEAAMSCAEGSTYDTEQRTCVPVTG